MLEKINKNRQKIGFLSIYQRFCLYFGLVNTRSNGQTLQNIKLKNGLGRP